MKVPLFVQYIKDQGPDRIALQLEVNLSTVYNWKNLKFAPEPKYAAHLISNSRGILDFNDIYSPFFKQTKNLVS